MAPKRQPNYSKTQGTVLLIAAFEIAYKVALIAFTVNEPRLIVAFASLCLFPFGVILAILFARSGFFIPFLFYNALCILATGFATLFFLVMLILMPTFYLRWISYCFDPDFSWLNNNGVEYLEKRINPKEAYYFTLACLALLFLALIYLQVLQETVNKAFRKMKHGNTKKKGTDSNGQTEGNKISLLIGDQNAFIEEKMPVVDSAAPRSSPLTTATNTVTIV